MSKKSKAARRRRRSQQKEETMSKISITPAPIQVDNDRPIPRSPQKGVSSLLPLDELEVGQSFFFDDSYTSHLKSDAYAIAYSATSAYERETKRKFMCRRANENGLEGVRVWRTE